MKRSEPPRASGDRSPGEARARHRWPSLLSGAVAAALSLSVPVTSRAQESATASSTTTEHRASGRRGFTLETSLGGGFQQRNVDDSLHGGVFGLTFGIGWFVTEDLAVLGRTMSSIIWEADDRRTVTGVAGAAVQYWLLDRLRLEAGLGVGWGRRVGIDDFRREVGFGLMTGAGVALWQNGRHAVLVGVEYAPVFLGDVTIHAAGGVIGWQLL